MTIRAVDDPNRVVKRWRARCKPCAWFSEPWAAESLAVLEWHHNHRHECTRPLKLRVR